MLILRQVSSKVLYHVSGFGFGFGTGLVIAFENSINQLSERLTQFEDAGTGVVKSLAVATEIYQGSEVGAAPDLVVGYAQGYRASWQTSLGGVPTALIEDNNKNWSGDHCVDPDLVPGVLFTSFPLDTDVSSIRALPGLIAETF
jgi:hypothetical protein